jgi:hypothetical protein
VAEKTDEKRVLAEIYNAGDTRQHHGDTKRTVRQDPLSWQRKTTVFCHDRKFQIFFNIGAVCAVHVPFFLLFSTWLDPIESGTRTIERVDQRSSQANVGGPDSVSRAISLLGRCLTPTRTRGLTTTKIELTQNKYQNLDSL